MIAAAPPGLPFWFCGLQQDELVDLVHIVNLFHRTTTALRYLIRDSVGRPLIFSIVLLTVGALVSAVRFGPSTSDFMDGSGEAVLEAGSVLMVVWSVAVGFSMAAIGAVFELSKLPYEWKLRLLRQHTLHRIGPFLLLALISGIVPFVAIVNTDTTVSVQASPVFHWLLIGFVLQLLLMYSGAKAAVKTSEDLSLIPAVRTTLDSISDRKLLVLKEAHEQVFKADHESGPRMALIPMSGFSRGIISGKASEIHDDLRCLLASLFSETEQQTLDAGIRIVREWCGEKSLKDLDGYLQYRLVPSCLQLFAVDRNLYVPGVLKTRLFYLAQFVGALGERGASLTLANFANPFWEVVDRYSRLVGMSSALEEAEMAIDVLLTSGRRRDSSDILLLNLRRSVGRLVAEHSQRGLAWLERLVEWHRFELDSRVVSWRPDHLVRLLEGIELVYAEIERGYGDEPAMWVMHDLRYWILVCLRRMQEGFVEIANPDTLTGEQKRVAVESFDCFDSSINRLLAFRRPRGETESYERRKHPTNPYVS